MSGIGPSIMRSPLRKSWITFRIEKDLAAKINMEVFHGVESIKPGPTFTWYDELRERK